jgi:hypothetical protein
MIAYMAGKQGLNYIGDKRAEYGEEQALLDELAITSPQAYAELRETGQHPQWFGGLSKEIINSYLRRGLGYNLESAAREQTEAVKSAIGAQLGASIRQAQLAGAQRGMFRSGTTLEQIPAELTKAANRDLAQAIAGILMQKAGMAQQAYQADRAYNLEIAQMNMQQQQAKMQDLYNMAYMVAKSGLFNNKHSPAISNTMGTSMLPSYGDLMSMPGTYSGEDGSDIEGLDIEDVLKPALGL